MSVQTLPPIPAALQASEATQTATLSAQQGQDSSTQGGNSATTTPAIALINLDADDLAAARFACKTRILEIKGFPATVKTRDIHSVFAPWDSPKGSVNLKWIDDQTALVVFNDPVIAKRAYLSVLASPPAVFAKDYEDAQIRPYVGADSENVIAHINNRSRNRSVPSKDLQAHAGGPNATSPYNNPIMLNTANVAANQAQLLQHVMSNVATQQALHPAREWSRVVSDPKSVAQMQAMQSGLGVGHPGEPYLVPDMQNRRVSSSGSAERVSAASGISNLAAMAENRHAPQTHMHGFVPIKGEPGQANVPLTIPKDFMPQSPPRQARASFAGVAGASGSQASKWAPNARHNDQMAGRNMQNVLGLNQLGSQAYNQVDYSQIMPTQPAARGALVLPNGEFGPAAVNLMGTPSHLQLQAQFQLQQQQLQQIQAQNQAQAIQLQRKTMENYELARKQEALLLAQQQQETLLLQQQEAVLRQSQAVAAAIVNSQVSNAGDNPTSPREGYRQMGFRLGGSGKPISIRSPDGSTLNLTDLASPRTAMSKEGSNESEK